MGSDKFTLEDVRAAVALLRKHERPKPYGCYWWNISSELEAGLVEAEAAGESLDAACRRLYILRVSPRQFTDLLDAEDDPARYVQMVRALAWAELVQEADVRHAAGLAPLVVHIVIDSTLENPA